MQSDDMTGTMPAAQAAQAAGARAIGDTHTVRDAQTIGDAHAVQNASGAVNLDTVYDLVRDIIDEARSTLMMSLRFMDLALWRMPVRPASLERAVATDGYLFFFDALRTIRSYQADPNEMLRDYLHTILHCVFHHPFENRADLALWDAACDIAVEAACMELTSLRYPSARDGEREKGLKRIKQLSPQLTAEKIYRVAANDEAAAAAVLEAAPLFARDDHSIWERTAERTTYHAKVDTMSTIMDFEDPQHLKGDGPQEEEPEDNDSPGTIQEGAPAPSSGGPAAEGDVENGDRFSAAGSESEAQATIAALQDFSQRDFEALSWKDISKLMEIELEQFTGKIGVDAGTFEVNLTVANRKTYDYKEFLKRFAALSEELKVSTDEFDYIFYTYGLNLYKNMPLIEPLEYSESNRIREFVIAIDTSASCAGGLVKTFIEKTYDVLKSTCAFGRKMNVHVIQCDCDITKDTVITEAREIDDDFFEFKVRGHGGTDFRPVFSYVNQLIENRELTNLKGLLYLTDGLGKFPDKPPDYDTAFVFMTDPGKERFVPPWAMKVVMTEDEIIEL